MAEMETLRQAARLICKGLRPRLYPHQDREYGELVGRYGTDLGFREIVTAVADGLELLVLDVSEQGGAVLAPVDTQSLFAMGLSDYRASLGGEGRELERGLLAVLQVAIAASFYPTAERLDDLEDDPQTLRISDIREVLLNLCAQLEQRESEPDRSLPPVLRGVWQRILEIPAVQPDERRAGLGSLDAALRLVLRQLEDQGLVQHVDDADGGFYFPNRRYRVMLRERSVSGLFELCYQMATAPDDQVGSG